MREAGRALALDPTHAPALEVMTRLLVEPPAEVPAEVQAAIDASMQNAARVEAASGIWGFSLYLMFVPFMLWMGVRDWWLLAGLIAVNLTLVARIWWVTRQARLRAIDAYVNLAIAALFLVLLGRTFGPLIFIPAMAALTVTVFVIYNQLVRPLPVLCITISAVVVPVTLEWLGVLPPSYAFEGNTIIVLPGLLDLPPQATPIALFLVAVTLIATPAFLFGRMRDAHLAAERRLRLVAWQLQQAVPERARTALPIVEFEARCRPATDRRAGDQESLASRPRNR
jgi:eukaryotic-like serine/threonine-protein kinase